jgi:DNA-binding transcriptional LysR family regulator
MMTGQAHERQPNIRHLAAFVATVRHGSVTRASKAVNLTQPALTQAIARLEGELGCVLFERGAAGMAPTEPALLLLPRVEAAIELIGSPRVTGTQMRAFLAVARAGSYAAASKVTGLTSASLHRAVADLAVALRQQLVDRRGRSVALTPAGERRARAFGLAMAELRAGFAEVMAWHGRAGGRIVVGAMPLSRARWLPEAILRFTRAHPAIGVAVVEGSYAELVGPLRDGEIDLVLGALRDPALAPDLVQVKMFEDRPAVMMRADHPLAARPLTGPSMLAHPWIMPGRDTPLRGYWEAMMGEAGVSPPPVWIECGAVLTLRQLLLGSDALTMLSPAQLAVEIDAGLIAARQPPVEVVRPIGMLHRPGWRPTDIQEAFLAELRNPQMLMNFV